MSECPLHKKKDVLDCVECLLWDEEAKQCAFQMGSQEARNFAEDLVESLFDPGSSRYSIGCKARIVRDKAITQDELKNKLALAKTCLDMNAWFTEISNLFD